MYWADVRGFSNTRHVSVAQVMVLTVAFDFTTVGERGAPNAL